ncbi:MAG: 4-hydroxy-tetrahydrodipicolinate reductase [Deltaproteobacteria bacterium]|nr:4-hydroxy-tetrahydrodipicolinate reductase [Deltaproteobacteria bacterium]
MRSVVVAGAAGRMGKRLVDLVNAQAEAEVVGALEYAEHPLLGKDAGEVAGIGCLRVPLVGSLKELDGCGAQVMIDFTAPQATLANLEWAVSRRVAMVIGTTGINAEERSRLVAAAREIPLVFAPNMSVGVNVLFKVVAEVAAILGEDFDVEILEAHHRLKKDAPSGTAVRLGEIVAETLGRNYPADAVFARQGFTGERTQREIGMQTLRAGDIVGEHTVMFGGMGERLEIIHRAHSRDNFAAGAVRAALWLADRSPGLYDMQDVLGLKQKSGQ